MRSIQTRIMIITMSVVILAIATISFLSVYFIRKTEHRKSDQILLLLCETGENNLDYYFNSVQKSVAKVSSFVESDLDGLDDEKLADHVKRAEAYFDVMASKTNGVLTYYYRIDPAVSTEVKGFWYTDLDGRGFTEHEVTDITEYNVEDTSELVWFTVPKYKGEAIWLPPYYTDNLKNALGEDVRVISYNVPIFFRGTFVGVVGIEIDYSTMAEQVDSIRLYDNGYAFLSDAQGNLFYHPRIDISNLSADKMPAVPDGVLSESTFIEYTFEGEKKEAAWLPLSNGMRLNVTVPVEEMEGEWRKLILNILIGAVIVLIVASLFTLFYTKRITKPLKQLNDAAEQVDKGNYDFNLTYNKNDELGRLTGTFTRLAMHMKDHIGKLHTKVYVDALTHVKNKAAYSAAVDELQAQMDEEKETMKFAIGIFDCDDLKHINDQYGHEKGDVYLKTAGRAICGVYLHSPVYRIGGDEFAVFLKDEDYNNREFLIRQFEKTTMRINGSTENEWEQVNISVGIAEYNSEIDHAVSDVARRADKNMYENKRIRKKKKKEEANA